MGEREHAERYREILNMTLTLVIEVDADGFDREDGTRVAEFPYRWRATYGRREVRGVAETIAEAKRRAMVAIMGISPDALGLYEGDSPF